MILTATFKLLWEITRVRDDGAMHFHTDLGDVPTWVAAIGTVGALFAVIIQMASERRRRHRDEERDHRERHRSQAQLVAAIIGPTENPPSEQEKMSTPLNRVNGRSAVDLINSSAEPVYSLVVGITFIQGAAPHTLEGVMDIRKENRLQGMPVTTASVLPGGTYRVWIQGTGWTGIMAGRPGAEVAFTDRAGTHWIRRATGELEELPKPPFEYFQEHGLYGPYELQTPERLA